MPRAAGQMKGLHKDDGDHHGAEQDDQSDLDDQDQGKPEAERRLANFVMEEKHPRDRADAAADDRNGKKHRFRDSESVLHRTDFVRSHGGDAYEIYH